MVKYVSTYSKGTLKQWSTKDLSNSAYAMFFFCFFFFCFFVFLFSFFFLIFFKKAYVVGTHLNCIEKSMQFKWVPTTFAFIKR